MVNLGDTVSAEAFDQLKKAMDQLQDKVCRTMNENANLSEHNQQLEHLIVQLQGETDTVGMENMFPPAPASLTPTADMFRRIYHYLSTSETSVQGTAARKRPLHR